MNNEFDELAKGLAQSVTRRGALKKFGVGLGAIALASFRLANKAHAGRRCHCKKPPYYGCDPLDDVCLTNCRNECSGP